MWISQNGARNMNIKQSRPHKGATFGILCFVPFLPCHSFRDGRSICLSFQTVKQFKVSAKPLCVQLEHTITTRSLQRPLDKSQGPQF